MRGDPEYVLVTALVAERWRCKMQSDLPAYIEECVLCMETAKVFFLGRAGFKSTLIIMSQTRQPGFSRMRSFVGSLFFCCTILQAHRNGSNTLLLSK